VAPATPQPDAADLRRPEAQERTAADHPLRHIVELTLHLVRRDLARRHRRSVLGWAWSMALPVAQLAIFFLIFGSVLRLKVPHFAAFLFIGIAMWTWFSTATNLAVGSLEDQRSLVLRPRFPAAVLPVVAVLTAFVDYLFAIPVMVVILAVQVGVHPSIVALVPLAAIQLLLCVGTAWVVSVLNVFFRDVRHAVTVALLLGFYLTPIFYERSAAPTRLGWMFDYNPLARLIEIERSTLLDGTWPNAKVMLVLAATLLAFAGLSFALFRRFEHRLPDEL
jgi:ABC-type polysaccharide/polyol phosphate export permease